MLLLIRYLLIIKVYIERNKYTYVLGIYEI